MVSLRFRRPDVRTSRHDRVVERTMEVTEVSDGSGQGGTFGVLKKGACWCRSTRLECALRERPPHVFQRSMRVAACNAARAEDGRKYGLNRLATLHLVQVLILTPNSWEVEYAKSPLVCRAADARQRKPAVMKRSGTMATADRRRGQAAGVRARPGTMLPERARDRLPCRLMSHDQQRFQGCLFQQRARETRL